MASKRKVNHSNMQGKRISNVNNSDDDFITPPPQVSPSKNRQMLCDKNVKKVKLEKLGKETLDSIYMRNPPRVLVDELSKLTSEHISVVKRIGFEHVLDLAIGKLPLKPGFWLVDHYDSETNTLMIEGNKLKITRESVHAAYGFPLGDEIIASQRKASTEDPIVQEFQHQFPADLRRIRVNDVIPKMLGDKEGGRIFLINFLVLVVSVLIGAPGVGTVNQKFLTSILDENRVIGLDWCGYTIKNLNESRKLWNREDKNCIFTGPLSFLVIFYVSCISVERHQIIRKQPFMVGWTTSALKERQQVEEKKGGFGKVTLVSGLKFALSGRTGEAVNDKVASWTSHKESWSKKRIRHEKEMDRKEGVPQEKSEKDNSTRSNKEFAEEVGSRISMISKIRIELEDWLQRGLSKFPASEELNKYSKELHAFFGVNPDQNNTREDVGNVSTDRQTICRTPKFRLQKRIGSGRD